MMLKILSSLFALASVCAFRSRGRHSIRILKRASLNMKDIAVFFDGTGNDNASSPTNIKILSDHAPKNAEVLYYPGAGTVETAGASTYSLYFDKLMAYSCTKTVDDACRDLLAKYEKGDNIHVYGFSRGAHSARVFTNKLRVSKQANRPQEIKFLGLFDTVPGIFKQLKLPSAGYSTFTFRNVLNSFYKTAQSLEVSLTKELEEYFKPFEKSMYDNTRLIPDELYVDSSYVRKACHIMATNITYLYVDFPMFEGTNEDPSRFIEYRLPGDHCDQGGGWVKDPMNEACPANDALKRMASASELSFKFPEGKFLSSSKTHSVLNYVDMSSNLEYIGECAMYRVVERFTWSNYVRAEVPSITEMSVEVLSSYLKPFFG